MPVPMTPRDRISCLLATATMPTNLVVPFTSSDHYKREWAILWGLEYRERVFRIRAAIDDLMTHPPDPHPKKFKSRKRRSR